MGTWGQVAYLALLEGREIAKCARCNEEIPFELWDATDGVCEPCEPIHDEIIAGTYERPKD